MPKGNVLLDTDPAVINPPSPPSTQTVAEGAAFLIRSSNRVLGDIEDYLFRVRRVVKRHSVSSLVAVLGAPAATELQNLYTRCVTLINDTATEVDTPPIE